MLWKNKKRHRLKAVVAQSLKPVKLLATCKWTRRLPTLLTQQCWEILRFLARSLLLLQQVHQPYILYGKEVTPPVPGWPVSV